MSAGLVRSLWPGRARDPDSELLARARTGDVQSFDLLRQRHDAALRGFVARRIGPADADDITQEVWIACWKALEGYAGRSGFKAWLYGIACHKCADSLRGDAHAADRVDPGCLEAMAGPDDYTQSDLRQTVAALLGRLPAGQREVLELYYYADLTLAQVAAALGRNENTVKYQFYRAHSLLAAELGDAVMARA